MVRGGKRGGGDSTDKDFVKVHGPDSISPSPDTLMFCGLPSSRAHSRVPVLLLQTLVCGNQDEDPRFNVNWA